MNKQVIDLKKTLSEVFEIKPEEINIDSSAENISKWDSLSHVRLIVELEESLSIKLDAKTASRITDIKKILMFLKENNVIPKSKDFLEVYNNF